MASGGIRYDFTTEDNFTQGENRTVRFPVKDSSGALVSSFSGWEFAWYLFTALKDNKDAIDTGAIISKSTGDSTITTPAVAPNVDVLLVPNDTLGMSAKTYWYELWRVDTDDAIRLAWGQFPIVN